MSQAQGTKANDRVRRRPLRARWRLLLAIALLCLAGGLFLGTRSWFILAVVEPQVERMLGGEVTIDGARWVKLGRMELSGVSVRVPNHEELPGPAGEVASIGRVTIDVKLLPLAIRRLSVLALSFDDVTLRLAEDVRRAGRFTFFELRPHFALQSRQGMRPPRVEVRNVTLESGEYNASEYTVNGRRRVAGEMHPMSGDPTMFTFELTETDERGAGLPDGLRIKGRWDTATLSHMARLDGLDLDERTLAMCPQIVRLWWRHMDLAGRIEQAKLDWTIGDRFTFELDIEAVELTLPEQVEAFLVRYHNGLIREHPSRPRMELHSGTIRWIGDGVELDDLEGRFLSGGWSEDDVVQLPYRLSISIDDLPPLHLTSRDEWLTRAMDVAAFHMTVETGMDVTTPPNGAPAGTVESSRAVDLPLLVARVFEQLQLADLSIDTNVEVWREPSQISDNGSVTPAPIQWFGRVNIHDGSLRVAQFPYRLYGVEGTLRIEQNAVHIEELHAGGSGESRFSIDGEISMPSQWPAESREMGFDVNIVAVHLPLDEAFFAALPEKNRGFFNSLFAHPLYESFERAGLVGEAAYPDDLSERLREIEIALSEATAAGDMAEPDLLRERALIIAQLERGSITLGGNVHLNLRAQRDSGPDRPTRLTGTIEPDAVGVVFDRFPYPFTVIRGKLEWSPDRISIVGGDETSQAEAADRGLEIILPGGGRGTIAGGFDRPMIDGRRRLQPDLHFEIVDEPMNELLAAAIPLTEHDRKHLPNAAAWPGDVFSAPARLLQGIGLTGSISATGRIETSALAETDEDDGQSAADEGVGDGVSDGAAPPRGVTYGFDIHLDRATARPTAQLAEHVGAAGLFWPETFTVRDVQGHLSVTDERIDLLGFHGWHGSGEVFATGRIDRAAEPTTIGLDVRLSELDLHESIINLVPREGLETARALWDRYQPRGRFTADLIFRETGDVRHPISIRADPGEFHVSIDGKPVSFTGHSGQITVTGGEDASVGFDMLHLNVDQGEHDHGDLIISGAYGVAESENPLHVSGEWLNAAVESPVISEIMRLIGADLHQQWYSDFSPRGRVDALFDYESATPVGTDDQRDDARGRPAQYWLSLAPRELQIELDGTPIDMRFDPVSHVLATPGHVQFLSVGGRFGESAFRVSGDVLYDSTVDAALDIDFHGSIASDEIMAMFPAPARLVLQQIEFDDGGYTDVQQSRLHIHRSPADHHPQREDDQQQPWTVSYDGRLQLNGASMQIGVPATEIDGMVNLSLDIAPNVPPRVNMQAAFDSFRVIDRLITDLRADGIRLSDDGTTLLIPEIRGRSYGGMVTAEAEVGMGEHGRYEINVELAGLALSELYADHAERKAASNGEEATEISRSPRGEVFGGVKLAGRNGRPETRSGRGTIRALGGDLENIPILLQAFSVLQLNIPLRGSLNQANAEFYIDSDRVVFERIIFESTFAEHLAVYQLIGHGWMDINTLELNTQFRSRGAMLVWRDIAGGLGDQFYLIEVKGTPAEPKARLLPLPWLLQPLRPGRDLGRAPMDP